MLVPPGVSFAEAMTYPGQASVSVRAVEWVREHGGGGLVDRAENWWYTRNGPPSVGRPLDQLGPALAQPPARHHHRVDNLPALPHHSGSKWLVASTDAAGHALLYTALLHPDPRHIPVVAAAALIPQSRTVLHLNAGTREPVVGGQPSSRSMVPTSDRPYLIAAFNAGFKMKDSGGGWYSDGRQVLPLGEGFASLVIHRDGHATVQEWHRADLGPDVVAVRQNLHLVVSGGALAAGLGSSGSHLWGTSKNQFQFTWRSGVGTDATGHLIYVAGRDLTLHSLALAMTEAGITTGMELDMHPQMVSFTSFGTPTRAANAGTRLLRSIPTPASRYLVPDQRDFFYLTTKAAP
ncbi:MAG: phosphodiester glycosidase family protein [Pedococcus sp.]